MTARSRARKLHESLIFRRFDILVTKNCTFLTDVTFSRAFTMFILSLGTTAVFFSIFFVGPIDCTIYRLQANRLTFLHELR